MKQFLAGVVLAMVVCGAVARPHFFKTPTSAGGEAAGGVPLPGLRTAEPATTGESGTIGLASADNPFARAAAFFGDLFTGTAPGNGLVLPPEASPVLPSALTSAPVSLPEASPVLPSALASATVSSPEASPVLPSALASAPRSDAVPSPSGAPVYAPSSTSTSAPVSPPISDAIPSPPGAPVYVPQPTSISTPAAAPVSDPISIPIASLLESTRGSESSLPTGITMIIKAVLEHSAFNIPAELYPGPIITPAPVIAPALVTTPAPTTAPVTTPVPVVYSAEPTTATSATYTDDSTANSFSISIDSFLKSDLSGTPA